MPVSPDYLADYRTLDCAPGCTVAELERAWRHALSRHHPDRAEPGRHSEAALRTQALNTAYRRLRSFADQHGRLPGSAGPAAVKVEARPQPGARPAEAVPEAPAARSPRRSWLAVTAVCLVLGASWLLQPGPELAKRSVETSTGPAPTTAAALVAGAPLELDSSASEVRARIGRPPLRRVTGFDSEVWEYGPSMVALRDDRVVDWYNSPLRPLPFPSERPENAGAINEPLSRR
ncbi:J domain-containing protein [Pseudomarimonas salicorniae]|uniref:J domain-containing protein n=1 Tax=Pseudomarimonas salicorniae TaxID=2933270 RepID=A0ABT0GHI7_9GAMM|nr:J domain-containing protein [Lysobacter sp. CAU 1642]MCK7593995.1 J domain-containing protein [Lysobacter sp. CAU 1642]